MAASEENISLFPIFILTIMALPLVSYTIVKLFHAASKKATSITCQCSVCFRSGFDDDDDYIGCDEIMIDSEDALLSRRKMPPHSPQALLGCACMNFQDARDVSGCLLGQCTSLFLLRIVQESLSVANKAMKNTIWGSKKQLYTEAETMPFGVYVAKLKAIYGEAAALLS